MILTFNDKRLDRMRKVTGIVAKNGSEVQVFNLGKLPVGWRSLQLVSLKSAQRTPTELRIFINKWLKSATKNQIEKWLKSTKIDKLPKEQFVEIRLMRRFMVSTIIVAGERKRKMVASIFAYDDNDAIEVGSRHFGVEMKKVELVGE